MFCAFVSQPCSLSILRNVSLGAVFFFPYLCLQHKNINRSFISGILQVASIISCSYITEVSVAGTHRAGYLSGWKRPRNTKASLRGPEAPCGARAVPAGSPALFLANAVRDTCAIHPTWHLATDHLKIELSFAHSCILRKV